MSLRKCLLVVVLTSFIVLVGPQAKLEVSVKEGEVAVLSCDVSALMNGQTSVDGLYLLWVTSDGTTVCDFDKGKSNCRGGYSNRAEISRNNTEFLLIINNTTFLDDGTYSCLLKKQMGHGEHVTTVNLLIQGYEKTVSLFWGESLEIYLPMTEDVVVQFTAAQNSTRPVECTVKKNMLDSGCAYESRAKLVGKALRLDRVTFADEGSYTVFVWTDIGKKLIMNTVVLQVKGLEENHVLEEGQNLSVSLRSLNSSYVEFWGETENSKDKVCEVKDQAIHQGRGYLHRLTMLNGSLILSNLTAKDHGKYIVREKVGGRPVQTVFLNISLKNNTVRAGEPAIGRPVIVGVGIGGIFVLVLISLYVYKWWAKRRMEQETRERAEEMDQNKKPDRITGGQGQEEISGLISQDGFRW